MSNPAAPAGREKKILMVVLIVANLLMLAVGLVTVPPQLKGRVGKNPPVVSGLTAVPSVEGTEIKGTGAEETEVEETADEGLLFSTTERPELEDFTWYVEDVYYDGLPEEAVPVADFESVMGGWKGLIIYDPEGEYDTGAMEFLNVSLAGSEKDLSLTCDWYLIFWLDEGSGYDETDMESGVYKGRWENNGLWASGAGTIRLTQFYQLNEKQYAIGTMDTPDGVPALIALVRP